MSTRSPFRPVVLGVRLRWSHLLAVAMLLAVAFLVHRDPSRLDKPIAAIIGTGAVLWLSRRPGRALQALIVLLPFHTWLLSGLYVLGVPSSIVRSLGLWKELAVASLVVAAVAAHRRRKWRLDRLDAAALAYIACVVVYYLAPRLFAQPAEVVLPASVRNLALRADILFVVVLVAARHCGLDRSWLGRLGRTALAVGTVVAALGVYEFLFSSSWNHLAVHTFQIPRYKLNILKVAVDNPTDIRVSGQLGGHSFTRIGSTLLSPLSLGSYLLIPLAVAVERIARRTALPFTYAAVGTIGSALLLTQTRSAILGGVLVGLLALRPGTGRSTEKRVRFALIFTALVIIALPLSSSSGLSSRVSSAVGGHESSTQGHIRSLKVGLDDLIHQPLGRGLGTSPVIGQRFDVAGRVTSENYYLQVGNEVGVHTMIAFLVLTVLLLRRLAREGRVDGTTDGAVSALRAAAWALAIGCLLLHVWQSLEVALTFWGLAGAMLTIGSAPPAATTHPDQGLGMVSASAL